MTGERLPKVLTCLTAWALLFSTLTYGQMPGGVISPNASRDQARAGFDSYAEYLIPVAGRDDADKVFGKASQQIARLLTAKKAKSVVLIDNFGTARESVLDSVAAQLEKAASRKRLYRINWNAVFSTAADEAAVDNIVKGILSVAAASTETVAIYLDDLAGFS